VLICEICGNFLYSFFSAYFYSLNRSLIILYFICFGCYILFTRQPDYFDGEKAPAFIQFIKDSSTGVFIPNAVYNDGREEHRIDARYIFREWKNGDKAEVIYETATPEKAAVYGFWGYWISWKELAASVALLVGLFGIAMVVTKNPTPEALLDQVEYKEQKKRKYKE